MSATSAAYLLSGAAGSGYAPPVWNTVANYHRLSYDALGALTLDETLVQSSVLWSTSTLYDGWQQQHYDANGRRKDRTVDAFGDLTQVTEYNTGGATYTTTYGYDVAGNLTQVTDALGNTTSLSYDLLGRKTAMNDPDMGQWLYQYDAVGNLTNQRDARNRWLYLAYDDLDRLVSKRQDDPVTGALIAEFFYDAPGQLGLASSSRSYTADGVVEVQPVSYDSRNRPLLQQWSVPGTGGGVFRVESAYNAADQKSSLTYPGGAAGQPGEVVSYGYDAVGQLVSVSGLGGIQYMSSALYDAQGRMTQLVNEAGNGANGLTANGSMTPPPCG